MIPNSKAFGGGNVFEQDGEIYFRKFIIEKPGRYWIRFRFISVNSSYEQGIALQFSKKPKFKGEFRLQGMLTEAHMKGTLPRTDAIPVVAAEDCPENVFEAEVLLKEGNFAIANASDILPDYIKETKMDVEAMQRRFAEKAGVPTEEYRMRSFTSGAVPQSPGHANAFRMEKISENSWRFHCNDHAPDDDFDDLIFDMEIEKTE